ncbi:MAG: hypothetical protein AB7H43_15695, partial [Acidimicrobiia bacterium]
DAADGRRGDAETWGRTSFDEFQSARERFLERLRVDSEVRRLEGVWQLPAREPRLDDRTT